MILIDEANQIRDVIEQIRRFNDGKETVSEMKHSGSRNWRQMEWYGFHAEEELRKMLIAQIGGSIGPTYGKTTFDYQKNGVWDIKAHPVNDSKGKEKPWLILNDSEAINALIGDVGGVGFIILSGKAEYDLDGAFKNWHEEFKGGESKYTKQRKASGRKSRLRKKAIEYVNFHVIHFDKNDILQGLNDGWIKGFQTGMRNSNDNPRREKFQIRLDKVPQTNILCSGVL